jgi:hypothetical protein
MGLAEGDQPRDEPEVIRPDLALSPVEPGRRIVLVVRVVVAALGVEELIARGDHRDPVCQEDQTAEVFRLSESEGEHVRGYAFVPLPAAVPAEVLRRAVGVALPVRLVVAAVVRDEVMQCETVVAGEEVDAL